MKELIRSNYQFIVLCFLWIATGIVAGTVAAAVIILLSVLLLKRKDLYQEIFLGFLLVLILSDSRYRGLAFAADVKTFYILLLAVFLFFDRDKFPSFDRLFFLFTPFLLIAAFLIPFSDSWITSLQKFISYGLLLFIAPNYLIKIYKDKGSLFLKNLVMLFALLLLIGFVMKYVNPNVATLAGRYRGIFGNPNGVGLFCTLFFMLSYVTFSYFPELFSKNQKIAVFLLIGASVYFCGSRNAIVSILCFLIFSRLYKFSPFFSFIVLCVIIVGYELLIGNMAVIINSLGLGGYFRLETLDTGSGRNVAWTFAWEHIQDNFFLGRGFAYDEYLFANKGEGLSMLGHQGNVHNSFLTIWLNTGVFGLLFFLRGFLLAFLKGARNSKLAFPVMFAVLFSANFESWMSASLNPITIQLWIIITILGNPEFNEKKNESTVPVQ